MLRDGFHAFLSRDGVVLPFLPPPRDELMLCEDTSSSPRLLTDPGVDRAAAPGEGPMLRCPGEPAADAGLSTAMAVKDDTSSSASAVYSLARAMENTAAGRGAEIDTCHTQDHTNATQRVPGECGCSGMKNRTAECLEAPLVLPAHAVLASYWFAKCSGLSDIDSAHSCFDDVGTIL